MTQAAMQKELHILMLEDSPTDAELIERELRKAGMNFAAKRVESQEAFARALEDFLPDIVLSDYNLPGFSGIAALGMVRRDYPETPVIIVTGALSDKEAVNLLQSGAQDYVLKDRLARLAPAVQHALLVRQGNRIRKQAEAQLLEKTELLENVINSSTDYIFVKDRELRTILCNAVFARALGKKPEDMYGKTDIENGWGAELVKGNPAKGIRGFEQDDLAALAGNVVHSSTDLGNVGGEIRNFDSVKVPLKSSDGKIFGLLGISRDVTERKQAEEMLRFHSNILQNLAEGVFLIRASDGVIVFTNPQFERMFGYEPGELLGKHVSVVNAPGGKSPEETAAGIIAELERSDAWSGEIRNIKKDGSTFWCHAVVSTFDHPQYGKVWVSAHEDITERKLAEEKIQKQAKLLDLIFTHSLDSIVLLDKNYNFIKVSESYARSCQRHMSEFPGHNHFEFYPSPLKKEFDEALSNNLTYNRTDRPFSFPDHPEWGTTYWDMGLVPIRDSENNIELLLFTLKDVTKRKLAEEALRENQQELLAIQHAAHIGSWSWDIVANVHTWTDEIFAIYGHPPALGPALYPEVQKYFTPESWKLLGAAVEKCLADCEPYECDAEVARPDGSHRWILVHGEGVKDAVGNIVKLHGTVQDITERKASEERLRLTAKVFENTMEGITVTDRDNNILEVNDAFTRITGYAREEVLGKNPAILKSGLHDKDFYAAMWRTIKTTGHWRGDIWNRRKDGEIYPEMLTISTITGDKGKVSNYVGIFSDITLLKQHEKQLEHIAHYDALTGIPNRVLLADRLQQAIAFSKREKKLLAVCYLDLDGFKAINDNMGHEAGDQVLIDISRRIRDSVREGDTVARLGGDEFVVLLAGLNAREECTGSLDRLLEVAAQPISVGNKLFKLSASIGVSLYPHDDDPDILLRHADQAMYTAKQSGKNRYSLYDTEHDQSTRTRREFTQRIQQGLAQDEFELFLQPKVNLRSGRPVGAEALIRWRHPERGLLSPAEFLPAIEGMELDTEMGEWVIATALDRLREWQQAGLDMELSVNISAFHMQSPEFSEKLRQKLSNYPDLPRGRLQIEILETAALKDIAAATRVIESCRNFGVGFALDDFGTGYSSLSYLSNLPIDTLKIDQSFVRDMLEDKGDFAIVQGIIALSRAFNLRTVAEGVETKKFFGVLLEMGCEVAQGYAIAHPMPAGDFPAWCKGRCSSGA